MKTINYVNSLKVRRAIRKMVNCDNNIPIYIIEGKESPKYKGQGFHWETKGGTIINYPSAYSKKGFSNMCYVHSTRRVEIGCDWIAEYLKNN